ncbi:hypothetical protein [Acanthamoeba polyphaga mimivirus]|nr:hypothetical protein [Acanthamoeba castellanii mamavirus]AHA45299.1 hypothetical protein HIRU_S393 [Hirudovirus strain Sangsue]EJN40980.1 hypothetical protein lvs_R477 [Acanthamoeba polyphaga lentillevirus]UMZ07918.1 hypothetical protein [Acanthamoeba polyphaga mimivirus]
MSFIDRNDGGENSIDVDTLRTMIDLYSKNFVEVSSDVEIKTNNIVEKLFAYFKKHNITVINAGIIANNSELIDEDLLDLGTINNGILSLNIQPVTITVDLKSGILNSVKYHQSKLVNILLDKNIDPIKIEPKIHLLLSTYKQYEPLVRLIRMKSQVNDFDFVYPLAAHGELDIIKLVMHYYQLQDEIIGKICVQAIINGRVNILEHFLTNEAFRSAPDLMYGFFIRGIEHGGHINITKYFIDKGLCIQQNDYEPVKVAAMMKRRDILKYFYELDNSIFNIIIDNV